MKGVHVFHVAGDGAISREYEAYHRIHLSGLRESHHVSQAVFARYLNTSEPTVEKCESGAKCHSGIVLKLLAIVQKHASQVLA